jgi:membrane protease YdiL (CAAX protease family)
MTSDPTPLPTPPPLPSPPPARTRSAVICWSIIVGVILFEALSRVISNSGQAEARRFQFLLQCRFAVGFKEGFPGHITPSAAGPTKYAVTPSERLELIPILVELQGLRAADGAFRSYLASNPPPDLRRDALDLQNVYHGGDLTPARRQELLDRHGWFAQLALTQSLPANDPARQAVVDPAVRALFAYLACVGAALVGLAAGLALGIVILVFFVLGRMPPRFVPATTPPQIMLEGFTIYLAGSLLLGLLLREMGVRDGLSFTWLLLIPLVAGLAWMRRRGLTNSQIARVIGFTRGRGVLREIFAGFAGYVAGLPLLAAGLSLSLILQKITGSINYHPIMTGLSGESWRVVNIYLLACIFAPITEEAMFRGLLLGNLRQHWRWLPAAALTSLIFAVIHPQGLVGIPVLGAIALLLAGLREQRDSLIASIAAHSLNNFLTVTLIVLLVR